MATLTIIKGEVNKDGSGLRIQPLIFLKQSLD